MPHSRDQSLIPEAIEADSAVISFETGVITLTRRPLPSEEPVGIVYGGVPFAVMMVTPSHLEDFAYGFSLTEGVIEHPHDIRGIRIEQTESGLQCFIDLTPDRLRAHFARRRAFSGRTGCGLCGVDDLASLPHAKTPEGEVPRVAVAAIQRAVAGMEEQQSLNDRTGAVHAAAWAGLDGQIVAVREDVGRHNALDKLIGSLLLIDTEPRQGFAIVTSRSSFELVEKVAAFGARTLVAISAPTARALQRARELDITLVGIARHDSMSVFHGIGHFLQKEAVP